MKKTIITAGLILIPTIACAFTTLGFKQYSAAGINPSVTCGIITTSDADPLGYIPSTATNRVLRGVTKKYSTAYFTPAANDKYMKVKCFATTVGLVGEGSTTDVTVRMSIDGGTTYFPISEEMLKCH